MYAAAPLTESTETRAAKSVKRGALFAALLASGLAIASPSDARDDVKQKLLLQRAPHPGDAERGHAQPIRANPLRSDTLSFGYVDEDGFAILDDIWTWDHGGADPLEGWYGVDVTAAEGGSFFRHITSAIWTTGTGNTVPAPILNGAGSAWIGAFENEADAECWMSGLGYGNDWEDHLLSPELAYTGSGNVTLQFRYFSDTENGYDYTRILLRRNDSDTELELASFTGAIGLATNHPTSPPSGATFSRILTPADFAGDTSFQVVFQFSSDGAWSDEDGNFETSYSGFGLDNVTVSGNVAGGPLSYTFETGLGGWTPFVEPGVGSLMGVNDIASYDLEDPCPCALSGNILEFHDDDYRHPDGQRVEGRSNPVDVLNDVDPILTGSGGHLSISATWTQYSVLPLANGVFYRPGWDYYPKTCLITGQSGWSGRVGQGNFYYVGDDPVCTDNGNSATSNGIPGSGVEQIRFVYEVFASCDAFGIPPDVCMHGATPSPLIDNVQIDFTRIPAAPMILFGSGTRYQDGFAQTDFLDPDGVGRADVVINQNFGNTAPFVLGDSLYVAGPTSTSSTRWEARLWFRIAREGPGTKPSGYAPWKTAIADGRNITGGEFTFAWMDSFQLGTSAAKNKFVSYLRENDDDYNAGGGELSSVNEIIRDDVLVAGSRIEYFVTANYTTTPSQNFTLPDTSGQFFSEFAILPSWELVDDVYKFPCLLYVDAADTGSEAFIEAALAELGVSHDRYDYLDPSSNWKAPLARGTSPSNNGVPLGQLLGYRAILLHTGDLGGATMWPEDFVLFGDWLTAIHCEGSAQRQGLIINGDSPTATLNRYPAFLAQIGATGIADAYHAFAGDENTCVRLEAPVSAAYGTSNSLGDYEYDAFGNWCPQRFSFDVLGASGGGVGNRAFVNVGTLDETNYAQVVNENGGSGNFRTVLDGVSYHHLALRGAEECVSTFENIVDATKNEIAAALEWFFDGSLLGLCESPCSNGSSDVPPVTLEAATVTRLYGNAPNPFHPRTTLRFSLTRAGNAELALFDASGRKIRALVQGEQQAGLHEVVWDGRDGEGHPVPAGVYWSQLTTAGHTSSKKLVMVK